MLFSLNHCSSRLHFMRQTNRQQNWMCMRHRMHKTRKWTRLSVHDCCGFCVHFASYENWQRLPLSPTFPKTLALIWINIYIYININMLLDICRSVCLACEAWNCIKTIHWQHEKCFNLDCCALLSPAFMPSNNVYFIWRFFSLSPFPAISYYKSKSEANVAACSVCCPVFLQPKSYFFFVFLLCLCAMVRIHDISSL